MIVLHDPFTTKLHNYLPFQTTHIHDFQTTMKVNEINFKQCDAFKTHVWHNILIQ